MYIHIATTSTNALFFKFIIKLVLSAFLSEQSHGSTNKKKKNWHHSFIQSMKLGWRQARQLILTRNLHLERITHKIELFLWNCPRMCEKYWGLSSNLYAEAIPSSVIGVKNSYKLTSFAHCCVNGRQFNYISLLAYSECNRHLLMSVQSKSCWKRTILALF